MALVKSICSRIYNNVINYRDVVYVTIINEGIIIFYELGAVVFWSFDEDAELNYIKKFEIFFKFKAKKTFEKDVIYYSKGENFNVFKALIIDNEWKDNYWNE